MKFTKMQGIGNDYVYVNGFTEVVEDKSGAARILSDRHYGIGSDGLIFINPSKKADFEMEMYNSDGTRAEMCGNGIRCVSKYVFDHGMIESKEFSVETLAGIKHIKIRTEKINGKEVAVSAVVDMGAPILAPADVPADISQLLGGAMSRIGNEGEPSKHVAAKDLYSRAYAENAIVNQPVRVGSDTYALTAVSMGNPHAVVFIDTPVADFPLEEVGPRFEVHPLFPKRTNTEFVRVIDRKTVEMRVWERGAGETLACGTGACAVVTACILNGLTDERVTVRLLGGDLKITLNEKDGHILMEGPATTVFEGEVEL